MVEVFKTNVMESHQAALLISQIQLGHLDYEINFDLEDCDRILRVKCNSGIVNSAGLIALLKDYGFQAEVLLDSSTEVHSEFINLENA